MDQHTYQTHTPHSERLPNQPGLQVFVLLFFHLLRFHEAWELWGNLRTMPPPASGLPALPQDGTVVSVRLTPACSLRAGLSFQGHCREAGPGAGRGFSPASPSWLLPEEPACRRAFPAPLPPRWVRGPHSLPETLRRAPGAALSPFPWRALAEEVQTGPQGQSLLPPLPFGDF